MEECPMDTLDEDLIDLWIETLQRAKTVGFESSSSPIEPLLEVMVDLALQLKNLLQEGRITWELRSNKTLKFSEFQVDALANPKVLSSEKRRNIAWDPLLSTFFAELAQSLISVKKTHHGPENLYYSRSKAESSKQSQKQLPKLQRTVVYHYRRRTRLRKKK